MSNKRPSKKGLLFVVSAPAGTGKTTLVQMITDEFSNVKRSISCTTRKARPGEISDVDYRFLTAKEFEKLKKGDEFLESATVFGHQYGTARKDITAQLELGTHIILVIDTQGALQVRKQIPAVLIFIRPPDFEELQRRLRKRGTESDAEIAVRLEWAKKEMKAATQYDYSIVNANLANCYDVLRSVFIAEMHRTAHGPTVEK